MDETALLDNGFGVSGFGINGFGVSGFGFNAGSALARRVGRGFDAHGWNLLLVVDGAFVMEVVVAAGSDRDGFAARCFAGFGGIGHCCCRFDPAAVGVGLFGVDRSGRSANHCAVGRVLVYSVLVCRAEVV